MKILILIGMVIVFISVFFMFFIYDTSIKNNLACFTDEDVTCGQEVASGVIMGAFMILMFIVIDIITIYIIGNTALSSPEAF